MITLFTGAPGAGKTAALVQFLSELEGDRPLFVDGLEGLTLSHTPCDASKWNTELPDGAILVIDEVQRVWRPTAAGSKVPESIAALETHRHHGIDVYLTTQAPRLLHSNVRALVGRHVHIRDVGVMGRHWYEWTEINDAMAWKTCVNKKRYKLPKSAFSLYKSASVHTVPVRTVPRALYYGAAALLLLGVLAYMSYRIVSSKMTNPVVLPQQSAVVVNGAPGVSLSPPASMARHRINDETDWIPKVGSKPESAPAYEHLRVVVSMPLVVGGYCQAGVCYCVTQQGTDSGIGSNDCQRWLDNPPFNPYRSPDQHVQTKPENQQQM